MFDALRDRMRRRHEAAMAARKQRPWTERVVREYVMPLALVVAVMSPIRSSIADWNDVPTGSMRPTILEGDRIYVNKLSYGLRVPFTTTWVARWSEPERGDIVTFASPADGTRLVKRVVGLPGDRIALKNNVLYINGEPMAWEVTDARAVAPLPGKETRTIPVKLAEEQLGGVSHSITLTPGLASLSTFAETLVPKGQYFVMGDNRDMSSDSRFHGCVPLENIYGKAPGVALSLDPREGYTPRWERWMSGLR